jgi:chorismate mutase
MIARDLAVLPLRVGVQGEPHCFSHAALEVLRGDCARAEHFADFDSVLAALEHGAIDRALLPVYNSLAGPVGPSLRAIAAADLRVEDEVALPIRLCVLGLPGSTLSGVKSLSSHPVALRQCSRFFTYHPWIVPHAEYDTAGAARLVAEAGDPAAAALASREAGENCGLVVLRKLLPDDSAAAVAMDGHLATHLRAGRAVAAIRGATTIPRDDRDALHQATAELLAAIAEANGITPGDVISTIFTATPDVTSDFPAVAARAAGWEKVPLLCTREMAVAGALPRCLRVLLHVESPGAGWRPRHIYLREAAGLRPDIVG